MREALDEILLAEINGRRARVGVIGLGYVGLPLMLEFGRAGFPVLGLDIDPLKIEMIRSGQSYLKHIPAERLARFTAGGGRVSVDFDELAGVDCAVICVPTPLGPNRQPDLSFVEKTGEAVARRLRPGQLIILESTSYPGTTREVLKPILERSGLRAGEEFFLAFSPEREDPGNPDHSLKTTPKLVGGLNQPDGRLATALYQAITRAVPVSSLEVAEAAKILENVFRSVNIALVNELKIVFDRMGLDIWEIIEAAKTKPFGFMPFYPGPGLGGHCIPIDPFYLSWRARGFGLTTRFIELAGEINTRMPEHVVGKLAAALNEERKPLKGSRILILGAAYKKDVDDLRESPSLRLMDLLFQAGAEVSYHDPHLPRLKPTRKYKFFFESAPLTAETLQAVDAVIIATDHSGVDYDLVAKEAPLVVDTRNALARVKEGRARVVKA